MSWPLAKTQVGMNSIRLGASRMSAKRPGAIWPRSRARPKCSAVLSVAFWIAVIGFSAEEEVLGIETVFGDGFDLFGHVVPRGTEPEHRFHPLANAGDGILRVGAFVIIFRAPGDVPVEGVAQIVGVFHQDFSLALS
jgi:hypothetical protein